ncbi:hypothetical protein BX666DRAFT_1958551 [Dichotomocladium elegans]|nr:hypothetical protein BX666DRAFT_1958551 [Dichotomocladium elegans]
MLKDIQKNAGEQSELEETISDMKRTQNDLQARLDNCQQELEASRRENAQLRARIESSNKNLKEETEKCRTVKEELSRAKHNMQYMKSQYAHETRRHETELAKIKERLYRLMDERQKVNVTGMVINEPFPGEDNDMGISEEKAMYSDLLQKSRNREQNARLEADKLRELVADVYLAVSDLLASQITNYKDAFPSTMNGDGARDYPLMRLPLDIGGAVAISRVHDLLAKLKEEWDHQISRRKAYSEEDMTRKDQIIERLEQSNDELIDAIQQLCEEFERKASMYMRFADRNFFDNINPYATAELSDSEGSAYEEDERTELSLRRTRKLAMKEQEKITAEAIRLGDERRKLAAERWAFEDMKRELTMQELLNGESESSPSRYSIRKGRRGKS